MDRECLIIDDIEPALARLNPEGRHLLREPAQSIAAEVRRFADRRGWTIVPHESFSPWAIERARSAQLRWVTLDPLLRADLFGAEACDVRLTRAFGHADPILNEETATASLSAAPGDVGIIDDAAATGRTLWRASMLLARNGTQVKRVLLCAATRSAREGYRRFNGRAGWEEYIPGDWRIVHLRDGCPYLPFGGRPIGGAAVDAKPDVACHLRIAAARVPGNLWQVLRIDGRIDAAVKQARSDIESAMLQVLGRPAEVRDLSLLGENVTANVKPGDRVEMSTELGSLN